MKIFNLLLEKAKEKLILLVIICLGKIRKAKESVEKKESKMLKNTGKQYFSLQVSISICTI